METSAPFDSTLRALAPDKKFLLGIVLFIAFVSLFNFHYLQVDPSSLLMQSHCDAGQQYPSCGGTYSVGSEATPAAAKKQSLHLEEAKEMCPEGHELSESYRPDGLPYVATSKFDLSASDIRQSVLGKSHFGR